MALSLHTDIARLPAPGQALLAAAARSQFQLSADWFAATAATALPPGARPLLLLWQEAGQGVALLALQRLPGGRLASLTTFYTTEYRPLVAEAASPDAVRRAGQGFGRFCRWRGPVRLDAMDPDWPGRAALLDGLRAAGVMALPFAHFGNWHLPLAGQDWDAYLAGRPGALRETIRRRAARAARDPHIRFSFVDGPDGLAEGLAAYEAVYARSWKEPEPFPQFGPAMLQAAAAAGVLRLGVLWRDDVALAAQYWTLSGGTATVLKLAYDAAAKALSPGTVLTAEMIRRLITLDHAQALDFGRGDDPYKLDWTGTRRGREGLLLCSPWHPAGLAAVLRQRAADLRRKWQHRAVVKNP